MTHEFLAQPVQVSFLDLRLHQFADGERLAFDLVETDRRPPGTWRE